MAIRVCIIDDEAPARRELKFLLGQIEDVEITCEAASGTMGLKKIRELAPDVVFLDITMPGLNGLELSQILADLPTQPLIVFATAYEQYALQAFDVSAFDYILKPFELERLQKTFAKIRRTLGQSALRAQAEIQSPLPESCRVLKIPAYKNDRIIPLSPEKILCARAAEGDVLIQTFDGQYLTKSTLNDLEQKLAPCGFIRTHRSSLVNLQHIAEIIPWFNGSYKLILGDRQKTEILVSRYNAKDLKKHFDI
ncbi:MAG: response regulator transcription factor [Nitrospiraceae bacterium]|jgi:DNA-binding LytR/AlgR family response regulator|nr:response regulator transcription factor [Nitrospiraceae bacterium]